MPSNSSGPNWFSKPQSRKTSKVSSSKGTVSFAEGTAAPAPETPPQKSPRKNRRNHSGQPLSSQISWSSEVNTPGSEGSGGEGSYFSRQSGVRQSATSNQSRFSTASSSRRPPPVRRQTSAMAETEKEEAINLVSDHVLQGVLC